MNNICLKIAEIKVNLGQLFHNFFIPPIQSEVSTIVERFHPRYSWKIDSISINACRIYLFSKRFLKMYCLNNK